MSTALVARDAILAGVLLVEEFQTALDAFSIGVVSIAAVDYTANAFLCIDSTVALVDQCHEELRVASTTLLSPTFVREREESDVLLCLYACELVFLACSVVPLHAEMVDSLAVVGRVARIYIVSLSGCTVDVSVDVGFADVLDASKRSLICKLVLDREADALLVESLDALRADASARRK